MNRILLLTGGLINLLFALFHVALGTTLSEVLAPLSPDNQANVYTLNAHVAFTLFIFAYLALFQSRDLLTTRLGQMVVVAIALYWVLRAINQVVFYGLTPPDTPFWVVVCLVIGLVHLLPVIMERRQALV